MLNIDITKHFGICYTLKCNVACPHCADECGPHRTEKMSTHDIKFTIKQVAMTGFETIELYGGEPFLEFNQLSDLIRFCKQWGIRPLIYTNGFWGRNVDSAKEKLEILKECGLDTLAVSIDSHHQKSILIDYPLNVLRIAERLGIDNFCVFVPSMDAQEDDSIIDIVKKVKKHIYI
ncbi:MAG: radical SAM protein [Syntrophus sp. (in: bacteria)]